MATVVVTHRARTDLSELTRSHSLPADTPDRVRRSIEPVGRYPRIGGRLRGRWEGFRFVLGPWRWMVIVYEYDEAADTVAIVTIQDGRSAKAPTTRG